MPHPLAVYLEAEGLSQRTFAKRMRDKGVHGVSQTRISQVINGHSRRFDVDVSRAISSVTGIKLNDLLFPEEYGEGPKGKPVEPKRVRRSHRAA